MSQISVLAWKCDRRGCGKVWLAKEKPKACAKCKSRKWDLRGEGSLRKTDAGQSQSDAGSSPVPNPKNAAEAKPAPEPVKREVLPETTLKTTAGEIHGTFVSAKDHIEWYPNQAQAAQDKLARERLARVNATWKRNKAK
jgi:hypothetical protein